MFTLHEYYTPKSTEFQDVLDIFPIFVDYADIYVNTIMSTNATEAIFPFIIFNYLATYRVYLVFITQNVDSARIPAIYG